MQPSTVSLPQRDVYTVGRLNREVRAALEGGFPLLWVEGELSNVARPASGHLYLTLKDSQAQVRCAMFRNRAQFLGFTPGNGMQVLVRARVSLYEARGDFQLIVEHMEEAGDGALLRAFEALKQRLSREGLFDEAHKRDIPTLPRRIGVVTSPTGAAIRDILSVLRRRFPALPVMVYPVPVQGTDAAPQIAAAIRRACERAECDVLIVSRGGGSLEDLWAFNEEVVARAIHDSTIPVVSGVGHEIDFTIADFAADRRAPTPSAAAELVSPDQNEWLIQLRTLDTRLLGHLQRHLRELTQRVQWLDKRLEQQHPGQRLRQQGQRLDELEQRLRLAWRGELRQRRAALGELSGRLHRHAPVHRVQQLQAHRDQLSRRLAAAMTLSLERGGRRLGSVTRALDAVSPLATLDRGYAIVSRTSDQAVLRDARFVEVGERVKARLAHGHLICTVDETHEEN